MDVPQQIDKEKALALLGQCYATSIRDPELGHLYADEVLVSFLRHLGFSDVSHKYEIINKWYS